MKSLIKKLANTDIGILLRNSLNLRPLYLKHYKKNYPISVSDAFLWRTDDGYKTKLEEMRQQNEEQLEKIENLQNNFYKLEE